MEKTNRNIYIPQWHVEKFLYFLRGHMIEGDVTRRQLITAIDTYLKEIKEAAIEKCEE